MSHTTMHGGHVTTNNVPRLLLSWDDLTDAERAWFDYPTAPESTFVRYRGTAYDIGDMMRTDPGGGLAAAGWHAYEGETVWSAVVVRLLPDDSDRVIVGHYVAGE